LSIRKDDVNDNVCIIISSLEAFRKEKTLQKKYKVYQENGSLLSHFENMHNEDGLEKDEEGTIINSLANVVRMSNPLIVIDEGHKTATKLSIDFIKDLNPSFIIEYSATPRSESNILVDVHASELKAEQMVKIPIVLESSAQWQNAVERGIEKRIELEKDAKKIKGEYIRPIALLQAQPRDENVSVENLKAFLLERKIRFIKLAEIRSLKLLKGKFQILKMVRLQTLEYLAMCFGTVVLQMREFAPNILVEFLQHLVQKTVKMTLVSIMLI